MQTLSIIIPVFNEASTIEEVLRRVCAVDLAALGFRRQVIVCDDGSTDESSQRIAQFAIEHPEVVLVLHERNAGKGRAIRTALEHATGEYALIQDADLEYDVDDYPVLLAPLSAGADVVFGSRFRHARWPAGMRATHFAANRLLTAAANLLYRSEITDEATCFKLVRTTLLRELELRCERFEFCPELTAKLGLRGIRIHEVPVRYRARDVARGKKVRLKDAVQAFSVLLSLWAAARLPDPRRLLRVVAVGCALASIGHATYAAWWSDRTWDEPAHLAWAARLLHTGETERRSQPAYDSKTPILLPHVAFADALGERSDALDSPRALFLHRLPTVVALALLYLLVLSTARRWYGADAGFIALALVAADPNLVAHGALATVDLIFALTTLLALVAAVRFWRDPRPAAGVLAGAALGLCLVAKFSALLLVPLCLLAPPLCGMRPARGERPRTTDLAVLLLVAAAAGWLVVAAAYGFAGIGAGVRAYPYQTSLVRGLVHGAPHLMSLLPVDFWSGIDICLAEDRHTDWNAVVLGRHYPHGVWFYFPIAWLLKTPLPLLLVSVAGAIALFRAGGLRDATTRVLAVALVVLGAYFCFVFHTHKGYRYVLMCLPLGALLATAGLARVRPRAMAALVSAAALGSMVGQLPYLGNPLAYTNALVHPKASVYRYLTDSNIDWLQTDRQVAAWVAAHPSAVLNPPHLVLGRNVIGVNEWTGVVGTAGAQPAQYAALRGRREPDGHLYFTHLVFDVGPEEFARVLDGQRRLRSDPECPLPDAASVELSAPEGRDVKIGEVVCISPREGEETVDVSLTAEGKGAALGHFPPRSQRLAVEEIGAGGSAWHRVDRPLVVHTRGAPFSLRVERGRVRVRVGLPAPPADRPTTPGLPCEGGLVARGKADEATALFVRGTWAGWDDWSFARLHPENGCYSTTLLLPAGELRFKIAGADWAAGQGHSVFGAAGGTLTVGTPGLLALEEASRPTADATISLPESGRYTIELRIDGRFATLLLRPSHPDGAAPPLDGRR